MALSVEHLTENEGTRLSGCPGYSNSLMCRPNCTLRKSQKEPVWATGETGPGPGRRREKQTNQEGAEE